MGILLVYDVTDDRSFNSMSCIYYYTLVQSHIKTDIRTWHANIEQHASEGVNKVLIGNKSDWTDKRAVSEQDGRELAEELGIKFIETSAKINEGVEDAFFTLARYVNPLFSLLSFSRSCLLATSRRVLSIRRPMLPTHLPPRHLTLSRLTSRLLYRLRAAAHRFSYCNPSRSHPFFSLYIVPHVLSPIRVMLMSCRIFPTSFTLGDRLRLIDRKD